MSTPINLLIVEDSPEDAELTLYELRRSGFSPIWQRVETRADYLQALQLNFDIILADYSLPQFDAMSALQLLRSQNLDIPFIIVSGTISDELAVEFMKQGAADYLLKDRMVRLGTAVKQALTAKQLRDAKRQTELALQESEARFRRLAENAPDIIYRLQVSPILSFEYVSSAITSITGYTPGELYADPQLWVQMLHPDDREGWQQWLTSNSMFSQPYIVRMFRKDGEIIWLEMRETPIYDEMGNLRAIEGIAREVSDRQQILLALHESAFKYRKLFEYANDSIFIIDPQTHRILDVNENAAQCLGYTREELLQLNIHQIGPPEAAVRNKSAFEQLLKNGSVVFEQVHRHKDGRLIPVEISSRVIESSGRQVFQSFVRDITQRQIFIEVLKNINENLERRVEERTAELSKLVEQMKVEISQRQQAEAALRSSEEKFRQLAENIHQVFWMTSSDRRQMLYVSPAYEKLWGRSRASLYEQPDSWIEFVHPCDRANIEAFIQKQSQGEYISQEFQIVRPDGSNLWIGSSSFPIHNERGEFYRIAGIAEDISERKRAEAEIYKALAKEKELAELRTRFVTMASHEFRTPLSTILSAAELLEHYGHQWTEAEKQAQLQQIQIAVKHMTLLLEDVMLIGRAETGQLPFQPILIDLKQFCQLVVNQMQVGPDVTFERCSSNLIQFNCQFLKQTHVYLDEKFLRQILSNLLSNAMKYSPPRGTVWFELRSTDEWVIFQVEDRGIGIPPEAITHLFEAFYRGSNVKAIAGTGLGLAIVKKCVDLHGGTINVQSQLDVGTTFTVQLPVRLTANS